MLPAETTRPRAADRPLRFLWRTDRQGRFEVEGREFLELAGARTAAALGGGWTELADALGLDPHKDVEQAFAAGSSWSDVVLAWPLGSGDVAPVRLAGFPTFDAQGQPNGYRGFGLCLSDDDAFRAAHRDGRNARVNSTNVVVPFRTGSERRPALSPVERNAFQEIARTLQAFAGELQEASASAATEEASAGLLAAAAPSDAAPAISWERLALERLPAGVLVLQDEEPIFANRAFLQKSGFSDLDAFRASGGLARLLGDGSAAARKMSDGETLATAGGTRLADARLFALPIDGAPAAMLVLADRTETASPAAAEPLPKPQDDVWSILSQTSDALRAPLHTIIGLSELAREEGADAARAERWRGHLRDIAGASHEVLSALNDLLHLADMKSGAALTRGVTTDVNAVVQQSVAAVEPEAMRARVILRTALAPKPPQAGADLTTVRQIVGNLLAATVETTPAGGQIIVSTACAEGGGATVRIRHSGASAGGGPGLPRASGGAGHAGSLALSLARALAQASRTTLALTRTGGGALWELAFPPAPAS